MSGKLKIEQPSIVAFMQRPEYYNPYVSISRDTSCDCVDPLMTVAQHERIVAALTAPQSAPETSVVVERELLERVERYFSGFVSDEPPAYALGSNGLATIRAILSSKGDV
ncbi:hypothetical protein ACVTMO_16900 [Pseudomonas segetis]